jgi:hypothetical protein
MVFRTGYGIYFAPEIATEAYNLTLNNLRTEDNITSGAAPQLTIANGFPETASTGFTTLYGLDQRSPTPYMQQWNASIQQELPAGILFEVAYIGSKGTHLGLFRRFNTPAHVETGENLPPRPGDLQSLRTFPELGPIIQVQHIGNSSYNSLQLKAEKRMGKGLSFLTSFVWSKSIDDANTVLAGFYDSAGAQDERNLRLERGLSFFNVGRRLSSGYVYNLPGASGFLRPMLRNWQTTGIVTIQDGTPENPFYSDSTSPTPARSTGPILSPARKSRCRATSARRNTGSTPPPSASRRPSRSATRDATSFPALETSFPTWRFRAASGRAKDMLSSSVVSSLMPLTIPISAFPAIIPISAHSSAGS